MTIFSGGSCYGVSVITVSFNSFGKDPLSNAFTTKEHTLSPIISQFFFKRMAEGHRVLELCSAPFGKSSTKFPHVKLDY